MSERIGYKVYVDVAVQYFADGRIRPLWLEWEDGRKYEITRVKKIERCASRRAGGAGIMYTCVISGKDVHLFYEENNRWFLEAKS
ncbi:MAG: hypothetical protein K6C95_04745 [Lachnospiraceae bacterium]|nr:hypothetical protein [Lachnospiraceae bacterium]